MVLVPLVYLLISTHAPLARCNNKLKKVQDPNDISTHAPLARCNGGAARASGMDFKISTHAPLARCNSICK